MLDSGAECPSTLQAAVEDPDALTVENFAFASIKNIKINGANVAAFRISYVGEQGQNCTVLTRMV